VLKVSHFGGAKVDKSDSDIVDFKCFIYNDAVQYSSHESSELSQWLCHDDTDITI